MIDMNPRSSRLRRQKMMRRMVYRMTNAWVPAHSMVLLEHNRGCTGFRCITPPIIPMKEKEC